MHPTRPQLLRPEIFAPHNALAAAFSTRHGGVSPAPYESLNLGNSTADDTRNVQENRRLLLEELGFGEGQLAVGGQVHGSRVRIITKPGFYEATDGLVTSTPGIVLSITAADCAAVLLADPELPVAGACHAGWRGAAAGIVPETLRTMKELGANTRRLLAFVSPCISVEKFEVGPEVAGQFDAAHVHHPADAPRPFVDLKSAVVAQLQRAGVSLERVEVSSHCTAGETDAFFSHRAENGLTGRMMGVIGLQ